jgi:hypothetical protein
MNQDKNLDGSQSLAAAEAAPKVPSDGRMPSFLPYANAVSYIGNLIQVFKDEKVGGRSTVTLRTEEINDLRQAYHSFKANAPLAASHASLTRERDDLREAHSSAMIGLRECAAALTRIRLRIAEFDSQDQAALAIAFAVLEGKDVSESLSSVLSVCRVDGRLGHYLNDLCTHLPPEIHGQPCGHYVRELFAGFERELSTLSQIRGEKK